MSTQQPQRAKSIGIAAPRKEREQVKFSRTWAMPNADTFSVKPIGDFVQGYLAGSLVSVDPFARNKRWATYTNDLNPDTQAERHIDAEDFLKALANEGVKADLVIFVRDDFLVRLAAAKKDLAHMRQRDVNQSFELGKLSDAHADFMRLSKEHNKLIAELEAIMLRAVRQQANGGDKIAFQDALRECADQARAALAHARKEEAP